MIGLWIQYVVYVLLVLQSCCDSHNIMQMLQIYKIWWWPAQRHPRDQTASDSLAMETLKQHLFFRIAWIVHNGCDGVRKLPIEVPTLLVYNMFEIAKAL